MKRRIWLVFAVVLALGVTAHFMVRSAEDKVTADMLSRAGRFAIPADWKPADEIVRPERFMCISTNPCPSLSRRWETGKELTDNDVAAVVSGVGVAMTADGPCKRESNVIGNSTICIFTGKDGEFTYWLPVASPGPGEPQKVGLNIRARMAPD
ncbi:hypothetical protein [Pseudarthrobacter oxydans]|uniref:hypothetical protein n=1 Tax=Pseudarthrobacter oxydans TaxID=1671 RepID=UPI002AA8813B|nr:hypothetical protein [Pseudarthrobacter oxydans]WPU11137.1 hypothetical protein SMD14_09205 [Pseudarthrobacter oxydans]